MVFEATEPDIDDSKFMKEDWSAAAYEECRETLPKDMPEPRGSAFTILTMLET